MGDCNRVSRGYEGDLLSQKGLQAPAESQVHKKHRRTKHSGSQGGTDVLHLRRVHRSKGSEGGMKLGRVIPNQSP